MCSYFLFHNSLRESYEHSSYNHIIHIKEISAYNFLLHVSSMYTITSYGIRKKKISKPSFILASKDITSLLYKIIRCFELQVFFSSPFPVPQRRLHKTAIYCLSNLSNCQSVKHLKRENYILAACNECR